MELSKCNLDLTIQKRTLVSSEIYGFGVNIFFHVQKIYFKLDVIGDIQENEKKKLIQWLIGYFNIY